jgi:hypothetical protein
MSSLGSNGGAGAGGAGGAGAGGAGGAGAGGAGGAGAASARALSPVFVMFGHSASIPVPPGGELPKVPAGCILVTVAECGDRLYVAKHKVELPYDKLRKMFNDPDQQHILADPVANQELIERTIGMKININYPTALLPANRSYMDIEYYAQLAHNNWPVLDHITYHTSGLYRGGTVHTKTTTAELRPSDASVVDECVKQMFPEQVIYPSRDAVLSTMERLKADPTFNGKYELIKEIGKKFKIKQSELFDRYPGVYYVMSCRDADTKEGTVATQLRRSGSRGGTLVIEYKYKPSENKMFQGFAGEMYALPVGTTYSEYNFPQTVYPTIIVQSDVEGRQVIQLNQVTVDNDAGNVGAGGAVVGEGGAVGGAGGPTSLTKQQKAEKKAKLIEQVKEAGFEGDEDELRVLDIESLEHLLQVLLEIKGGKGGKEESKGGKEESKGGNDNNIFEYPNNNSGNNNSGNNNSGNQDGGRRTRRRRRRHSNKARLKRRSLRRRK